MTESSWAGVITAIATVFTALGGLVLAFSVLVPTLRKTRENVVAVNDVHTMVNQQRTDMLRYQETLVTALQQGGIKVPADTSLRPDKKLMS